jgi:crotonobetainyl-CoA:carnitine CoA-transferase CaiB-like acyl-CoA transferase
MLEHCRVLDLTTERGFLCGQILGDLGADVIKIEPREGVPARQSPPFLKEHPGLDSSIPWLAFNRNKRGITLNLESEEGCSLLRRLAIRADILIESENPGAMAARKLAYRDLRELNPALVYVSITPFGQDGPKATYNDSDLILMAASGVLILMGDEDRPPLRMSVPQAYLHASADAAGAALIAYYERLNSGQGQHVDVAAQESLGLAGQSTSLTALIHGDETRRMAGGAKLGPIRVPLVWPCKDGLVSCVFLFGSALGVFTRKLVDFIFEKGECNREFKETDWISYGAKLLSGEESMQQYAAKQAVVGEFMKRRTKVELFQMAREHNLLIAPLATLDDVRANPQFIARNYWQTVENAEGLPLIYPGPFARFSSQLIQYRRRPPKLGEHNSEIYIDELGLRENELADLARKGII